MKRGQWSDVEKIILAKSVLIAQKNNKALSSVFDVISKDIGRSSSAVGMYYYNSFRYELESGKELYEFSKEEETELLKKLEGTRDYIHWTDEEKLLVESEVEKAIKANKPLTDVWIDLKKEMPHRSVTSISAFYYRNIKEEDEVKLNKKITISNKKTKEPEEGEEASSVDSIINALVKLASKEKKYREIEGELSEKVIENKTLKEKCERLKREHDELTERLAYIEKQYEDAQGLFNTFVNMASISQIMGLGDFKEQMKTTIDKWGNVLKTEMVSRPKEVV